MKMRFKRLSIFLLFTLPILYFLFTMLFFSPFEEPFGRIDFAVPRDVDLFVCKEGLMDDFDRFPVPRFFRQLEVNSEWRAFTRTEHYMEIASGLELERYVGMVREAVADLPLIDPLKDVLGREIAFAGKFREGGDIPFSYAAFFRCSWKAKLAFELFCWDWARGMAGDDLLSESSSFSNPEGYRTLVLGDGREFYLKRSADLVLFGDDEELVKEICDLIRMEKAAIDLSLGGRLAYREVVSFDAGNGTDHVDIHANLEQVFNRVSFDDEWKENKIDFSVMTAMDIFDPSFFKTAAVSLKTGSHIDIESRIDLNTESVGEAETGFFGIESVPIEKKLDFLSSMLPEDVFFAGCARVNLELFLKIMENNLDPEMKKLINDTIRNGRRYNRNWDVTGIWDFIEKLDDTFGDMLYVALRPRGVDKALKRGIQPLPIIGLVLEIKNMEYYKSIEKTVVEMQNSKQLNFEMWQYKSLIHGCRVKGIKPPDMDDIEQIAYTVLDDRYFLLATSSSFLQDMLNARRQAGRSLKESAKYRPVSEFLKGHGNLAFFLDADGVKSALHDYAVYWAEVNSQLDLEAERKKIEEEVVRREFPKYAGRETLPADVERKVDRWADARMQEIEQKIEDVEIPRLTSEFRKRLEWIDLINSVTLVMNINISDMDLSVRISSLFSE